MLEVTRNIQVPESEFEWTFVRSGGPGGQNVNKVASRAVLRWNVASSPSVPADVKARFRALYHRRITGVGELIISSQRFRDQGCNVEDVREKLRAMLREAAAPRRPRKPTRPTRGAREARLREKKRRTDVKRARRRPPVE